MSDYCVVVVDAARARLFTLEASTMPEVESGPRLVEQKDLVNPDKRLPAGKMFADTKTGRRSGNGSSSHAFDDHRDNHELEFERRFAKQVAVEGVNLARSCKAKFLVLVANAHMLGYLRRELDASAHAGIEIREASSNLTKLSPQDIHEHLAKVRLLPACNKPGV